jgi:ribosome-binding factor A
MPSHRSLRVAEAIREVVATTILHEIADPRVRSVTVVRVEVTSDLRFATVFVSIMGSESQRKRSLQGLEHAAGFLQARVAARLQTRFTPVLSFKYDDSVRKSAELSRLIDEAVASDRSRADEAALSSAAVPEESVRAAAPSTGSQPVEVADPQGS